MSGKRKAYAVNRYPEARGSDGGGDCATLVTPHPSKKRRHQSEPRSVVGENDTVCDCNALPLSSFKLFRNFRSACQRYGFPGSHQVGSYGPKGKGIVRTYSNGTPGKDIVLNAASMVFYRLKDENVRRQFDVNRQQKKHVRVFRKVDVGVLELGDYQVAEFVQAGPDDAARQFGCTFVKFVRVGLLAL